MTRYRCTCCGYEFDESAAVVDEDGRLHCPNCSAGPEYLVEIAADQPAEPASRPTPPRSTAAAAPTEAMADGAPDQSVATDPTSSTGEDRVVGVSTPSVSGPLMSTGSGWDTRYMTEIQQMARTGKAPVAAMGLPQVLPGWDDIMILGAQLDPLPLEDSENVDTTTVIGKHAAQPLVIASPVFISHMSFGALSRSAKLALAAGSALAWTAIGSGEGGVLPEEMTASYRYIFEYVPNHYSLTPENLRQASAIEIKIGQGTKPGLGGELLAAKVTTEIAAVRNKPLGQDIHSPAHFNEIESVGDLKNLIKQLRQASGGRPIGVKLAAGHLEQDLAWCVAAQPDFVTIDGRGGGSGASPQLIRDATGIPTIYALIRARHYLDQVGSDIDLVITGGLRVSTDFAKALALGADAVAIATAGLIALGCEQHRACQTGFCPTGIATQDPQLCARLDESEGAQRVANYLQATVQELMSIARLSGHHSIHDLSRADLYTTNRDIAERAQIAWA
ncbi:MAG: glutamate synthase-related protein [Actinomycetia bacterium]|nr:glutamate synthase-related protein [Actinomycetes bacterium]